jgi:signal transduction histidine kinase
MPSAALLVLGALALTAAVEVAAGPGWPDAAGDAAAGTALLGAAGFAALRPNGRRVGLILGLAGAAWLAGTLDASLAALHRGPLVHALLAFPDGRLRSAVAAGATTAAYASGAVPDLANAEWLTIAVAAAVVAAAAEAQWHRRVGPPRLIVEPVALGAVLALAAAASLRADEGLADIAQWLYYAVVTVSSIAVAVRLARSSWTGAALGGLVAELGELEGADALRDRLARAIGDPDLVVGYRLGSDGVYVDATGQTLELPSPTSGRTTTEVSDSGEVIAVLVHDSAGLEDASLRKAVVSTARLAVANTRLRAELAARARQVAASRRRLVEAADMERRRLESELRSSAGRRLDTVAERLDSRNDDSIAPIAEELARARADLARLARGLHPAALTDAGLAAALGELAAASPMNVALDVAPARFPAPVEAATYFVCAEAMANATKHSDCRHVAVAVAASSDAVQVRISDDGRGGASPSGLGLLALRDRVEALGGRLGVRSPPGGGTHIEARLPVR